MKIFEPKWAPLPNKQSLNKTPETPKTSPTPVTQVGYGGLGGLLSGAEVPNGESPLRSAQIRVNVAYTLWQVSSDLTSEDWEKLQAADALLEKAMLAERPSEGLNRAIERWEHSTLQVFRNARLRRGASKKEAR